MNQQLEDQILPIVEKFVTEKLNGRYREHVSDTFLISLLMRELSRPVSSHRPELSRAAAIVKGQGLGEAYTAGCYIFESILEYACRAGGNGHHVAQDFNACFDVFARQRPDGDDRASPCLLLAVLPVTVTIGWEAVPTLATLIMLGMMFRPYRSQGSFDFGCGLRVLWLIPILAVWVAYMGLALWQKS